MVVSGLSTTLVLGLLVPAPLISTAGANMLTAEIKTYPGSTFGLVSGTAEIRHRGDGGFVMRFETSKCFDPKCTCKGADCDTPPNVCNHA